MSDSQIPKATMTNFIRQRIKDKRKISAEFIQTMLDLSKEYIDKVGALSNDICEKQGKKTITTDHFYKALKQLHMEDIIPSLQETQQSLKKKQQQKQEIKQKVQQNIQRRNEIEMNEQAGEQRPILEVKNELKPIVIDDDEDFGQYLNEEANNND